ncbi:PAS domain S-box protein [Actinotalea sp. K2]|uniref:sensor domain-containing protein n=1 Tax=Actinotalea sp. K2 TaxID=2939438 RepID=UPI002016D3EA|nr:PAS domain S-box protein [Actinotalea sp. K2]MCL3862978.1 PAS domain S-box protein [Actinotalea sp. K2]
MTGDAERALGALSEGPGTRARAEDARTDGARTDGSSLDWAEALVARVWQLEQAIIDLRREVEELTRSGAASRAAGEQARTMVEMLPHMVWLAHPDGRHEHVNQNWSDFTGLSLEQSRGLGWDLPVHPEDRDRAEECWAQAVRTGEPYEIEYRLRRADGVYRWMLVRAVPLRDEAGTVVRWVGTSTDIEELKRAEARVEAQARLLDQAQDAILVHDLEHRILYWNPSAERIHGWTADEAVGRSLADLICPDPVPVRDAMDVLRRKGEWSGELHTVDRSGATLVMEARWTLLRRPDGTPRAVLAVNTDVTERKRIETRYLESLEARATRDPLTGLANRAVLFDRLELLLGQRRRGGLAVVFLDLDAFKTVNDLLGHRAGDELLVSVGTRLTGTSRHGDVVARIGGDEFVVVGEAEDESAALTLGERLRAAVGGPTTVDGSTVTVTASVGVAFIGQDDTVDADDIVSRADSVMYEVKREDPGSVRLAGRAG